MTKEQETIERLKYDISAGEYSATKTEVLETVLNMLKKKDKTKKALIQSRNKYKEIAKKKDQIIDLMATQLAGLTIWNNEKEEPLILTDKEDVIKYFEEIAERKSEEC